VPHLKVFVIFMVFELCHISFTILGSRIELVAMLGSCGVALVQCCRTNPLAHKTLGSWDSGANTAELMKTIY
jgi:hypothetical protein